MATHFSTVSNSLLRTFLELAFLFYSIWYLSTCTFQMWLAKLNWKKVSVQNVVQGFMNGRTPGFPEKIWACCGWHPHWVRWDHPASSSFSSVAPWVPPRNTAPCTWPNLTWTSPWGAPWTVPPTPSAAAWACGQESAGRRMQALDVHPGCQRIWGSHRVAVDPCFRLWH